MATTLLPKKDSVAWPGALSLRDKILLESKTIRELCAAVARLPRQDWEAKLGWFEYLHADWRWLHEPELRAEYPNYRSPHKSLLRRCREYAQAIGWRAPIPATDAVIDGWDSLLN
jgi:hypothetical protein